jgi:hypothetical protein
LFRVEALGSIAFRLTSRRDTSPVEPLDFKKRGSGEAGFVPENLKWNVQVDQIANRWLDLRTNLTASHTNQIYIVNPELDFRDQRERFCYRLSKGVVR